MLKLTVQVPEARDRAGYATLRDGLVTVMTGHVAASATPALSARHGNAACDPLRSWGHPPFGRYRLVNQRRASPDEAREYGLHLLLFEPESGQALEAESFGRLALLAYGGPADRHGRLRRTQGGLRVTDRMVKAIAERLGPADDMTLELEPLRAPSWWQFWKRPVTTRPLSDSAPLELAPPVDESSLLAELLRNAVRRERTQRDDRDDTFDRDRRDDGSSSSRSSGPVQGRGGEFGGAGASGGWARGPGVDNSGRILGAAAAGTILGAAAGSAEPASSDAAAEGPESSRFEPLDSGAGTSSESSSQTGTAY